MDKTTIDQIEALIEANQAETKRTPFLDVMLGALTTARDNGNWHQDALAKAAAKPSAPTAAPATPAK